MNTAKEGTVMAAWCKGSDASSRRLLTVGCLLAGLAIAGCGDSSGERSGPTVTQHVTRDFGHESISADERPLPRPPTVMRLLREDAAVKTAWDGRVVRAIDGLAAREASVDDETTWAFFVNGIEADEFPPDYRIYAGDVVNWDLRDWYVTLDVRATVGAFPQPFTGGVFGKRFPTTVECQNPSSAPCRHVEAALRDAGVRLDGSKPRSGLPVRGQPQRARVLVGTWDRWRDRAWPRRIDEGPRYSGVFARFAPDGKEMRLLDWNGHRVRSEGAGTGLVAAMRPTEEDLVWLVTGLDEQGVARAARAFDADELRDAYAVAVTADGVEKLPLEPR